MHEDNFGKCNLLPVWLKQGLDRLGHCLAKMPDLGQVWWTDIATAHGETFYINFYYSIFQFREKRITLRIFVNKNIKLYNYDMKL